MAISAVKLTAFEQTVAAALADKASLAASLLEAWADLPAASVQSARSLVDAAQLSLNDESATQDFLLRSVELRLAESVPRGFRARDVVFARFERIAFALNAIELYRSTVHKDASGTNSLSTHRV